MQNILFITAFLCLFSGNIILVAPIQSPDAVSLTRDMIKTIAEVKTLKINMESVERIGDKYETTRFIVKRRRSPMEIYYYRTFPNAGVEVLLNKNSKSKILVNPGGFPWTTLDLDVHSSLVRDKQHHSIYEAGFEYFAVVLSGLFKKYAAQINAATTYVGKEKLFNKDCFKVKFENKSFKIYEYKTLKIETALTLASLFKISEYKILELNKFVKSFQEKIPAGTILQLPNDYAKEMLLWIDAKTSLPARMEVYDEKGLYEKYSFSEIVINPEFAADEFDKSYKDYHFK